MGNKRCMLYVVLCEVQNVTTVRHLSCVSAPQLKHKQRFGLRPLLKPVSDSPAHARIGSDPHEAANQGDMGSLAWRKHILKSLRVYLSVSVSLKENSGQQGKSHAGRADIICCLH